MPETTTEISKPGRKSSWVVLLLKNQTITQEARVAGHKNDTTMIRLGLMTFAIQSK
jgi:hypothetical protein